MPSSPVVDKMSSVLIARLTIGLAQGVALFFLFKAIEAKAWPATHGLTFAPMLLVAFFVPLVALFGWGNVRFRSMAIWIAGAAGLLVGLALHDILRAPASPSWRVLANWFPGSPSTPSLQLAFFSAVAVFIAHALVTAGDGERKYIASYPAYFDAAWKHCVQLVLSIAFVVAFWGVLILGARLFLLIGLGFLWELIGKSWFLIPATMLALAAGIHITDVRPGMVHGIRTLKLTLLSWLLPIMAVIAAAFLLSLPFTGLEPLWDTRFGTLLLLIVQAVLIVLINAAYQDGQADHTPQRAVRYAGTLGVAVLSPLLVIAIYGLALRVGQYGWTSDRIVAAACTVVAACYALGYAWSFVRRGLWLASIRPTNIAASFVILGILFVLFTPIADPARISVASQIARLESGEVSPQVFDFAYLRSDGARYGREALERLKLEARGEHAEFVKDQAERALSRSGGSRRTTLITPEGVVANVTMVQRDRTLPEDFLKRDWVPVWGDIPSCMRKLGEQCRAFFIDLNDDGAEEIVFVSGNSATVFRRHEGDWIIAGKLNGPVFCGNTTAALRNGRARPVAPIWRDLEINGQRFHLDTRSAEDGPPCR